MATVTMKNLDQLIADGLDVWDYGLTPEFYTRNFAGETIQVSLSGGYMVTDAGFKLPFRFADL